VMSSFVSVFEDSLSRVLKQYGEQARVAQETHLGVNLSSRAELCLKLASAPEWPSGVSKKLCLGSQLKSVFENGPMAPVITENLIGRPFAERACLFRDFSRQNRIYERFVDRRFNTPIQSPQLGRP